MILYYWGVNVLKCKKMERYRKVKRFGYYINVITNNCIKKIYDKMLQ